MWVFIPNNARGGQNDRTLPTLHVSDIHHIVLIIGLGPNRGTGGLLSDKFCVSWVIVTKLKCQIGYWILEQISWRWSNYTSTTLNCNNVLNNRDILDSKMKIEPRTRIIPQLMGSPCDRCTAPLLGTIQYDESCHDRNVTHTWQVGWSFRCRH